MVKFTERGYTVNKIIYSESAYNSGNNQVIFYFVDHKAAAEKDF
ncbi:hypothetical protein [Acetivibrio saccincola]|jgi:hypothetical protein|nr:hypothetical protein [Acetivibrio saccincola]HOA96628.1 hypothetical protein [Acetivibrio saccincola]HQD28206.1 hypothetical protein [Acetivibrio saccincola]